MKSLIRILMLIVISCGTTISQTDIYDSGGPLTPGHAAYDVSFYDLTISVFPSDKSIEGSVEMSAHILFPTEFIEMDLDTLLDITSISEISGDKETPLKFERKIGKVNISPGRKLQTGDSIKLLIKYGGKPLVARRPPWSGGFQWSKTKDGTPWIATSCQGEGSDIWWPSKDHVSDEPDSMWIRVRVPDTLFCASNGKLMNEEKHSDGTISYHWFVSNPINIYNVALNIGPYKLIEENYTSVSGDEFPVQFWVLPKDFEKGKKLFPQIIEHIKYFEDLLGPYPFRADKYGVVQTPHLGMEHQTIIAYGANFNNASMTGKDWGFDALHHHEFSHEWWGNLVTNADWKDMWIHEGFGTYMQALYVEKLHGKEKYYEFMEYIKTFRNELSVAPRESKTSSEIYRAPIYPKGAWVLHMLRYLIGDEDFFLALRRMAYLTPELERVTDGSQTRFSSTDEILSIAEKVSGKKLDWFFEVYLRQPYLPQLKLEIENEKYSFSWIAPDNLKFEMPIEISIDDKIQKIEMASGKGFLEIPERSTVATDPHKRILFEPASLSEARKHLDENDIRKAGLSFENALIIDTTNQIAKNGLEHIEYLDSSKGKNIVSLGTYVGEYQLWGNRNLLVEVEDDKLFVSGGMSGKTRLYAISENEFVTMENKRIYSFKKNDKGLIEELKIGRMRARKKD